MVYCNTILVLLQHNKLSVKGKKVNESILKQRSCQPASRDPSGKEIIWSTYGGRYSLVASLWQKVTYQKYLKIRGGGQKTY